MELIEIASTIKDKHLDMWVNGDIQKLFADMMKSCKKTSKPFVHRGHEMECKVSEKYSLVERDGMNDVIILVERKELIGARAFPGSCFFGLLPLRSQPSG